MAVTTTNVVSGPYVANGVTTVFPFTFKALTAAEVKVTLTVGDIAATLTGYDVALSDPGGTVTFAVPPTAGALNILSDPSFRQETVLENEGAFLPDVIEAALDRGAIVAQVLADRLLRAELGESAYDITGLVARLNQIPITPVDLDAVGNGIVNDRAAFAAADAIGAFVVPSGFYLIASSITFTHLVTFQPGARLVIPTGVIVTFAGGYIEAPIAQIFNITGSGSVAGLLDVQASWFCGDAMNNPSRSDGRALAQKAYDACAQPSGGSAIMRWAPGYMKHDGVAITVTKGQKTIGAGKSGTLFLWVSPATAGFAISGNSFASIKGLGCSWGDYGILPTSGIFIRVTGVLGVELEDIRCDVAYDSITFDNGSAACTLEDFNLYESFNTGVRCNNVGDIFISNFIMNTNSVFLTVGSVTGTFQPGEQVKGGTSNAQSGLQRANGSVLTIGYNASAAPVYTNGETVTGLTSGATAVISTARIPHANGGIRLEEHVEAFVAQSGDIIGGQYPMVTDAASNTQFSRPAYCSLQAVYFDSGVYGDAHNNSVEFDFVDCWWSNRTAGSTFSNCDGFKFTGGKALNNGAAGHTINATCTNFVYNGMSIRGNSQLGSGVYPGLLFKAGTSKFIVTACIGDDSVLGFGTQAFAVQVEAGASDRYQIVNNRFTAAQVSDGGTGVNKVVANNY